MGREVVVIGAGNVGCDVACEAYRLGAEQVTLVDIQKPLAFGKEKEAAEALGAGVLVAAVVGSGIMATNLTDDVALALLINAVSTVAALGVLIWTLGPTSGAHFNPAVTLVAAGKAYDVLQEYRHQLGHIFIVSQAVLAEADASLSDAYRSEEIEGLQIKVARADGDKCDRCWIHDPTVGEDDEHPAVCRRCRTHLAQIGTAMIDV